MEMHCNYFSFFWIFFVAIVPFSSLAEAVISPDSCSQSVDIPELSFSSSSLSCQVVWSPHNFILRHHYDQSLQRLSVLLSATFAMNWFAMGFSPTGSMVPASAMLGYLSIGGNGVINQYYLAGRTSSQVFVRQGNLTVIPDSTVVTVQNQTIYMAFQLDMKLSSAAASKVIYAYALKGQTPDELGYINVPHQDAYSMSVDFTTGSTTSTSSLVEKLQKGHGVVNIFAWALLAPTGAFIARYLRQRDPLWFYLHIGFQTSSYLLAIIGIAMGIKLTYDLPNVDWKHHRILGIFVFVLATLQVVALCARPGKESKRRNIWSWYHFLAGRFVLFLAAVNIVVGIRLAGSRHSLGVGYAIILAITIVCFCILESIYWIKRIKKRRESNRPNTAFSSYEMM